MRNHCQWNLAKHPSPITHLRSILLVLLVLIAGPLINQHLFGSSIRANADTSFVFAASGDLGVSVYSNASLNALSSIHPAFFLALGDLSYEASQSEHLFCNYVTRRVGTGFPFEIVSGNHEDGTEQHNGLIDNFARCLPDQLGATGAYGKEYYFDYPAQTPLARFIMISPGLDFTIGGPYSYTVGSPHYMWLSNAIDTARAIGIQWVIVGMHKVCISMGEHSCEVGPDVMNLLLEKRVDLILEGHEHSYQRSKQLTCIGDPTLKTPALFDPSCVADDGSNGTYSKASGSVIVIAGAFGGGAPSPVNNLDPEAPYFATGMGDLTTIFHQRQLSIQGEIWNSNTTGTGKGFVEYTLSASQLDAQLLLPNQITAGTLYSDRFSIVNANGRGRGPSLQNGGNPGAAILGGNSPVEGYLVLGVLAIPALYPAFLYLRATWMWKRLSSLVRSRMTPTTKHQVQDSARRNMLGRRVRRVFSYLLALIHR